MVAGEAEPSARRGREGTGTDDVIDLRDPDRTVLRPGEPSRPPGAAAPAPPPRDDRPGLGGREPLPSRLASLRGSGLARHWLDVVLGLGLVALVALVALWVVQERSSTTVRTPDVGPTIAAIDYVAANVPADAVVLADPSVRSLLLVRGFGDARIVAPDDVRDGDPGVGDTVDVVLGTSTADGWVDEEGPLGETVGATVPVARFGADGADAVEVRVRADDLPGAEDRGRAGAERARAGAALTRNDRLDLDPGAEALLADGRVDQRAMVLLATLLLDHRLEVVDFPGVDGEDAVNGPRRRIHVASADGQAVAPGGATTEALLADVAAQRGTWAPDQAVVEDGPAGAPVLTIGYDLLERTVAGSSGAVVAPGGPAEAGSTTTTGPSGSDATVPSDGTTVPEPGLPPGLAALGVAPSIAAGIPDGAAPAPDPAPPAPAPPPPASSPPATPVPAPPTTRPPVTTVAPTTTAAPTTTTTAPGNGNGRGRPDRPRGNDG